MLTIRKLFDRIRWDPEFGKGRFEIGYYDRISGDIERRDFRTISFSPGNSFSFHLEDTFGTSISIPFHRVRRVWKDGSLIWSR